MLPVGKQGREAGRPGGRQESRGEIIGNQIKVASGKMVRSGQIKIDFECRARSIFWQIRYRVQEKEVAKNDSTILWFEKQKERVSIN